MENALEPTEAIAFGETLERLLTDIERYLGAVALFRELGHEPSWRAESYPSALVLRVRAALEPYEPRVSGA